MNTKQKTNMLRQAIYAKFYPTLEDMGFRMDEPTSKKNIDNFRKTVGSTMKIFTISWGLLNSPSLSVSYTEIPVNGLTVFNGKHLSSGEITAYTPFVLQAYLRPNDSSCQFNLYVSFWSALFHSVKQLELRCESIVQLLNSIVPNVENWWSEDEDHEHFVIRRFKTKPPEFTVITGQQRKVSLLKKIFAREWVWISLFIITAFSIASTLFAMFYIYNPQEPDIWSILGALFACSAAGVYIYLIFGRVLLFFVILINGGPFHKGDIVQVIHGEHAGKIGRVYEEWPSRGEVKVDLGQEAYDNVKDVFSECQIIRTKALHD